MQTGIHQDDLEIHNANAKPVAIVIYVTIDRKGKQLEVGDTVTFSDRENTSIGTGPHAENFEGVWMFEVPKNGVYEGDAEVYFIRRKE